MMISQRTVMPVAFAVGMLLSLLPLLSATAEDSSRDVGVADISLCLKGSPGKNSVIIARQFITRFGTLVRECAPEVSIDIWNAAFPGAGGGTSPWDLRDMITMGLCTEDTSGADGQVIGRDILVGAGALLWIRCVPKVSLTIYSVWEGASWLAPRSGVRRIVSAKICRERLGRYTQRVACPIPNDAGSYVFVVRRGERGW